MDQVFAVVTDAPAATTAGGARSRIKVAKRGTFNHPKYGRFTVDDGKFAAFRRNFEARGSRVPIDFDHSPDKGGSSEAAGWITRLEGDGDGLYADVEWTPPGAKAIEEKRYLFISPTWDLDYTDDEGERLGPTLLAAGLTNRPYFSKLGVISLSQSFSDAFAFVPEGLRKGAGKGKPKPEADDDPKVVSAGSRGEPTKTVQEGVGVKVDGEFGPKTEDALKRFQEKKGVRVDGVVGRQTAAALKGDPSANRVPPGNLEDEDKAFLRKDDEGPKKKGGGKLGSTPAKYDAFDELLDQIFDADATTPDEKAKLKNLLAYYAEKPHPFTACVRDNRKRFGPGTEAVCATLKDIVRGTTNWRKGGSTHSFAEARDAFERLSEDELAGLLASFEDVSDSRPRMAENANIAQVFGLPEDASDEQIVAAATAAQEAKQRFDRDGVEPAEGQVMTADQFAELQAKAERGEQAAKSLDERDRSDTFREAVRAGKVGDAQRETFDALWEVDSARAKAFLESLPQAVATGTGEGSSSHDATDVPDNRDPARFSLDQRAQTYAAEHKVSYEEAVYAVENEAASA